MDLTNIYLNNNSTQSTTFRRTTKYNNIKVEYDNKKFDSMSEYERYLELKELEEQNIISNLRHHEKQDKITLLEDPRITYEPDFCYVEDGITIVEDVKGFETDVFKIKKKMIISKIKKKELNAVFITTKKSLNGFIVTFDSRNL